MALRRRVAGLAALVAMAAAALACETLIGVDYGAQKLATCTLAEPPSPPDAGNTGGSAEFTVAVYSIDWGDTEDANGNPRALTIGYDLDGLCTSVLDAPPCAQAAWTGAHLTDGPGGIDNAIGLLLHDQKDAFGLKPFTSTYLTESTQDGSQSPPAMFHVTGYNGAAIDDQVTVEWYVPLAPGAPPKWDGSDTWPVAHGTANADGSGQAVASQFVDPNGYVTGFHLVAHFPSGPPVNIANIPVATVSALVSADLEKTSDGKSWQLTNGILAGQGRLSELFHDVPALSASFAGQNEAGKYNAICKDTPTVYAQVKRWLCSHADSLAPGSSTPVCDAASFGMAFDSRPGRVGMVGPPGTPPVSPGVYCDANGDPSTDTCDTPD